MSSQLDEKELYAPVSDFFMKQGYFVASGCNKPGIQGTSEFGVLIEGQDMRVDIAAARWDNVHQVESIAVECKRLGSMRRSLGAGLWQATDYQVAFDKVFIATEASGEAGNKRSVNESLGLGHISVDVNTRECQILLDGASRSKNRFDESVRTSQVAPRLVMFLAFRDALGTPLRYGETFGGGGYIAKDMGGNIQYNCWFDKSVGKSYFGINIEHINSFRKVLRVMDWTRFQHYLKELKAHRLTLTKDPVPRWRSPREVRLLGPISCHEVETLLLRKTIADVVADLPRQWRPHMTITAPLWIYDKTLSKETCVSKINAAKDELSELIGVLKACV